VLRPGGTTFNERSTVVATDLRILSLARGGVAMRSAPGTGVFTVGLGIRDLRPNDTIETYFPVDGGSVLAPPPLPPPPAPLPVPLVDVNAAPGSDLARLPGMTPERVHQALASRQRQGSFADVEAFGVAVGLQPHEIVRLRARATAGRVAQRETGVRQLDI
jgi:hypothetical protein